MQLHKETAPKCGENCPIFGWRKKRRILSRLWSRSTQRKNKKKEKDCARYPAERILCEFILLELRIPVRIPERISVRISQVRCSLSWKVQMIMENPPQNSQQNPQQTSHGRVGEIFTDFFCRVGSVTFRLDFMHFLASGSVQPSLWKTMIIWN